MSDSAVSTPFGFEFGPMVVERVCHDKRIGWVVLVRPHGAYVPRVEVRCSPAGKRWSVRMVGCGDVTMEPQP